MVIVYVHVQTGRTLDEHKKKIATQNALMAKQTVLFM